MLIRRVWLLKEGIAQCSLSRNAVLGSVCKIVITFAQLKKPLPTHSSYLILLKNLKSYARIFNFLGKITVATSPEPLFLFAHYKHFLDCF